MAFTYDPTTLRGQVRLIIHDTNTGDLTAQFFQDEEIDAYLSLHDSDARLSAAEALDTIASSQVLLLKKVTLGTIGTDGPAVATALRNHATTLRSQVYSMEPAFDWAEMGLNQFSRREILHDSFLRDS